MEAPPDTKRALNIDSRQNQASEHQNPIEKYRQPTDRLCLFVFPIIIVVWLIICILGFFAPQFHDHSTVDKVFTLYQYCINAPILRFSVGFIASLVISIAAVCLSTFLTVKFTKFFVNIGLGLFLLSTIGYIYKAVAGLFTLSAYGGILALLIAIISVVYVWGAATYMVTAAYCYLKADKGVLCELTKDTYQAIIRHPSIVLFGGLVTVLSSLIFSFLFNALIYDIFALRSPSLSQFYMIIIAYGGLCALSFVPCLATVVIAEFAINYYWKKDENPSSLVGRSIANALRNHIGTIMFASIAFVPTICAIIQAIKHTRSGQNRENFIFYFVSKVYLALRMPEIGLIFTAIYGTGFVKSAQTAFDVVLRRSPLFLATLAACEALVYIPAFVALIGSIIVLVIDVVGDPDTVEGAKKIALVVHGLIYPLICFIILIWLTMNAMLINKIIMLNKEDKDTEGKVHVVNYA